MTLLTRREGLALAGAATIGAALPARAAPAGSLDALAQGNGMRFGSEIGTINGAFADPRYRALIEAECGLVVPENELKWQFVEPRPGVLNWSGADRILGYAQAHGLGMRGHNLVWHHPKWLPRWLPAHDFGAQPASAAAALVTHHIQQVVRRYGTAVRSWDVVNETVDEHTGIMRETVLSRAMGSPEVVVDLCFRVARAEAPHAQLVYNDYMSWEPGNENHRAGVLRLLDGFRRRNVPVDALGLQSHIGLVGDAGNPTPHDEKGWRDFLDAVTGMGYGLLVTEFDVNDKAAPADPAAHDAAVAAYARGYLDVTLSYPQVDTVMAWGLCDRYSWLVGRGAGDGATGGARRPCPYDGDYRAKPLREAIAAAFRAAPARRPVTTRA